uniref:Putative retrotransposon protein, Ty1-copia subclass n=1 Tax=Davidia involucrata TaxID=16924 RepID=A0A5B7BVL1_DAVIN
MDKVEGNLEKINRSLKPKPFNGKDFKRWQRRMKFWLTTLKLFYVISDSPPPEKSSFTDLSEPNKSSSDQILKFKEDDYACHGHILSTLCDFLYDLYCETGSAKDLWESLEKKYGKKNAGEEKYVVGEYFDFKMVEEQPVLEQAHQVQHLVTKIVAKGIPIDERLQVSALIDKLPSSWSDFQVSLKHKREEMTLDDLMVAIQIEEKHRSKHKLALKITLEDQGMINLFESKNVNFLNKSKNGKGKYKKLKLKSHIHKNQNKKS